MASQGPNTPTSASQTATGGLVSWGTPSNIETSGASYATYLINTVSSTSQTLKGAGFGFSIPSGATINGIVFTLVTTFAPSQGGITSLQLMKAGSVVGTAKTGNFSSGSYGSTIDLWGTTWTAADINNAGFGAAVIGGGTNYYGNITVNTNAWEVTVYYTPSGSKSVASAVGLFGF